jgi:hypothetical protein
MRDTIEMAREAQMPFYWQSGEIAHLEQLKRFETLARADERAQPAPVQQEPVAVVSGYYGGQCVVLPINPARLFNSGTAFYTAPPAAQKPWVGLSEEEVEAYDSWADFQVGCGRQTLFDMVRDIEAKLKEKNYDQ